jgi:phosphoadenosine phosphosulfate reductase
MGEGVDLVLSVFEREFGTSAPLKGKAIFLNKVPGEDRADEIIAHGAVLALMRFDLSTKSFELDLRQAGAELFADSAIKNVISFSGMSGHLKGKSIPGANIRDVRGDFGAGAPLILKKGGKLGAGVALVPSKEMDASERAVKVRSIDSPSGMPLSPDSDRESFVEANKQHIFDLESVAINEMRSYLRKRRFPVTVSFSGGKDSLAAYGIASRAVRELELIFVDTGIEFPETVSYVDDFARKNNLTLHKAKADDAFFKNVDAFGPPAKDFRWCCKTCKLGPITELIAREYPDGTITVEGNRMLESFSRADTRFVSKNPFVPNQITLNPVREWNSSEIWCYIWLRKLEYNPLYERDFERIGCYLCASSLGSEWENVRKVHEDLYERWNDHLREYAAKRGLPQEYADMGFWRWKVLPPKMVKLAEDLDLRTAPKKADGPTIRMLKGASSCAAGGFSVEAIAKIPRSRDFSSVAEALRTIGEVRYSDEFEIAMVKTKGATAKLFGGGEISVVSNTLEGAETMFERAAKALLRAQMCTSCGICAEKCPRRAIVIKDGLRIDPERCNSCGMCEGSCMVVHYYDKMITTDSKSART